MEIKAYETSLLKTVLQGGKYECRANEEKYKSRY